MFFVFLAGALASERPLSIVIRDAAICAAPAEDDFRKWLGVPKDAKFARYHYSMGGVPHSSMDMDGLSYVSFIYYSATEKRGILTFVWLLPDGRIVERSDFYYMEKTADGWKASNGNGGPGMYERVEKFVEQLMRKPFYLVDLRKEMSESCIDEREWSSERESKNPSK